MLCERIHGLKCDQNEDTETNRLRSHCRLGFGRCGTEGVSELKKEAARASPASEPPLKGTGLTSLSIGNCDEALDVIENMPLATVREWALAQCLQ